MDSGLLYHHHESVILDNREEIHAYQHWRILFYLRKKNGVINKAKTKNKGRNNIPTLIDY
ncbi:hypothetical protein B4902_22270 [Yersinia frederiksenii]|uniref:Uncharacterized protein n=1 Tax=Yersinia enterocolitica LC20 TaxID=1443113 RepID=A0A7U4K003_YEREN|nr:hypothetical protein LC20_00720 [Yersinia hibernica]OVZ75987.1 hypothetical protein CBW54_22020 [Yersinia kristensenii]OWF69914.1 hypothetical protein B4902_22270 [Yersinia frederiksenii]